VDAPPRADPPPGTARGPVPEPPLDVFEALALLGLDPTADRAAIDRAYRERSLACHPDKVAHLDPDFQALAQRKFVRLKAAYDLLTS
jgi:curved DNA-binding protein CbpA